MRYGYGSMQGSTGADYPRKTAGKRTVGKWETSWLKKLRQWFNCSSIDFIED